MITLAWFHMRYNLRRAYTPGGNKNDARYFYDDTMACQKDLQVLHEAGLRNIRFSDAGLAYCC
jgi:hypothetical protein